MFHKELDRGEAGDNMGALLRGVKREQIKRGMVLAFPGSVRPTRKFAASCYILTKEEGGRYTPFMNNYRPQLFIRTSDVTVGLTFPDGTENPDEKMVMPGDNVTVVGELVHDIALEVGSRFTLREGGKTGPFPPLWFSHLRLAPSHAVRITQSELESSRSSWRAQRTSSPRTPRPRSSSRSFSPPPSSPSQQKYRPPCPALIPLPAPPCSYVPHNTLHHSRNPSTFSNALETRMNDPFACEECRCGCCEGPGSEGDFGEAEGGDSMGRDAVLTYEKRRVEALQGLAQPPRASCQWDLPGRSGFRRPFLIQCGNIQNSVGFGQGRQANRVEQGERDGAGPVSAEWRRRRAFHVCSKEAQAPARQATCHLSQAAYSQTLRPNST